MDWDLKLNRNNRLIKKILFWISKGEINIDQLIQSRAELDRHLAELEIYKLKYASLIHDLRTVVRSSVDTTPWLHPFLTENNIQRFRVYSDQVWSYALTYQEKHPEPLKIGFMVNMAQNMYNWARLAQKQNADVELFLHPHDNTALSCPEWEEFDGDWDQLMDGEGFLQANPLIKVEVPYHRVPIQSSSVFEYFAKFIRGDRKPLLTLLAQSLNIRHEILFAYDGFYPYLDWIKSLDHYDVLYAASLPIAAYASGCPYCVFSVGGDLMLDCGRGDNYGMLMSLSFNAARFLFVSNPHTLGHSRRLGLRNSIYLPYPVDDSRYCPGEGLARQKWVQLYGEGVYVLMTSRIDVKYKGQDISFFNALVEVAKNKPQLRFIFLNWGESVKEFRELIQHSGMQNQFIVLSPVGKKKLIDYYRSCDVFLDQFVFGYYGATALEAASVGKPIVMKLRQNHYSPLYKGDVMPAFNAASSKEMQTHLSNLADSKALRVEAGSQMRYWLVRNHGAARTIPLMLSLLKLTADRVRLPSDLISPLWDQESQEEIAYHENCFQNLQ